MCDGHLREKLEIIKDLLIVDRPAEPQVYVREHLAWSIEELESYRSGKAGVDLDRQE